MLVLKHPIQLDDGNVEVGYAIEIAEDLGDWDHGCSITDSDEIDLGHQVVEIER